MEGGIQGERFEEILSFQFQNDNTMQLIMKKLYEQRLNRRPLGRCFQTWAFFVSMMNHQLMLRFHKSCIIFCVTINYWLCNIEIENKVKERFCFIFQGNGIIALKFWLNMLLFLNYIDIFECFKFQISKVNIYFCD
jgi:hypothetical protein